MDKIFDDGITNTYFFKKDGAKQGILSHRYCTYLSNLFEEITTIIYKYISTRKSSVVLHHFDNRGAGQYKNYFFQYHSCDYFGLYFGDHY